MSVQKIPTVENPEGVKILQYFERVRRCGYVKNPTQKNPSTRLLRGKKPLSYWGNDNQTKGEHSEKQKSNSNNRNAINILFNFGGNASNILYQRNGWSVLFSGFVNVAFV